MDARAFLDAGVGVCEYHEERPVAE